MATSAMWSPNMADFSKDYRVYAIDVMGQPSKSFPDEPIRNAADYAVWLTATLDGLGLGRIFLVGMSYGAWLALNFAIAAPDRVQRLVLLSPGGGFIPMVKQFSLRGMLMVFFPTRITVNWFMRWLGITDRPGETAARWVLELTYLGLKHFGCRQRHCVSCPRSSLTTNYGRCASRRCCSSVSTRSSAIRRRHWLGHANYSLTCKANWCLGPVTTCALASIVSWTRAFSNS
jgi:pimeloyl-ACP methyl ester carboxylesterase